MSIEIFVGRELPAWSLFWLDDIGTPVDLSTGYTFVVAVRQLVDGTPTDTTITATVTANATPTADTRSSADIPTLTVAPAAGQLDNLTTGGKDTTKIIVVATATSGGKDREQQWPAIVRT